MERISVLWKFFVTILKRVKMSQKQSTSACTRINIHSEIGKENKAHISKSYNLLIFTIKPPQKDEMMMKTKPCIEYEMRMNEMKTKPCI